MTGRDVRRPPGPAGRRLVGNAYEYDRDRIGFLRRCQSEYGDVFSYSPATIVVCEPGLVHDILERTNTDFTAESSVFGGGADRPEHDAEGWMHGRRTGSPAMARRVIQAHGSRIIADFDAALAATGGRDFDVMTVMYGYTSRTVADFLFGPGAHDIVLATDERSARTAAFMSSSLTVPRWLPLPSVRRAVRADDRLRALIADRVAARRAEPHAEPGDMLDLLLDGDDVALGNSDVIAVLKSAMLASVGSPGAVLTWALYAMLCYPRVHQRLRDEARRVLAETGSLVDDAPLTYTKAFIREVLRMWPPTWLMGRTVRRPCEVGGYGLAPGQEVMFSPYLLHRDERWWPEPDRFRPERWLERDPSGTRRAGAYLPFGSGPRICLGLHLSLYQLVTTTAHLAANYRVAADLVGVEPVAEAMLLPRGLRARVRLRGDATPAPAVGVRTDVAPVALAAGARR